MLTLKDRKFYITKFLLSIDFKELILRRTHLVTSKKILQY